MISKLLVIFFLFPSLAAAAAENIYPGEANWERYTRFVDDENQRERKLGTAYMVSGALAIVGGTIGYQQTADPFARTVFTISQSMGIAALGYGTYLLEIGNQDRGFHRAVQKTTSLTPSQKDELLANYLWEKRQFEKKARMIRAFTHGFIAALNFYNGSKQTDSNLQNVHYFIGGINLVAAVSFSF